MSNLSNAARFEDFAAEVRALARDEVNGAIARVQMLEVCIRGAVMGALSDVKPKGSKDDDAIRLYRDEYVETKSKKNTHSVKTIEAKSANFRAAIRMGMIASIDPLRVFNDAMALYPKLKDAESKGGAAVKQLYEAINGVIKAQNDAHKSSPGHELDFDEIEAAMISGEKKERDEEAYLRAAIKALELAYGKTPRDETAEAATKVAAILNYLVATREADEALAKAQETAAKAAALGYPLMLAA
jgi:hypothetical protein